MLRLKNPPSHNIGLKSGQTLSPPLSDRYEI